jgi:hypothetical protein
MRHWPFIVCVVLALSAGAGCGKRDAAYRFRAPLLSSVEAQPPAPRPASAEQSGARSVDPAELPARHERGEGAAKAADPDDESPRTGVPGAASGVPVAETMRAHVGERHKQSGDLAFARTLLAELGITLASDVAAVDTGAALLALADERDALTDRAPLSGDLVVFAWTEAGAEVTLVGVVVGPVAREGGRGDTVEFVYLGRGVVRRGYLTRSARRRQRDDRGRILNTFVRALAGKARKRDPFLAGQLFNSYVRIDRLGE